MAINVRNPSRGLSSFQKLLLSLPQTGQILDKIIEDLKSSLRAAEAARQNFVQWTPEQRLACELHSMMCTWNHTDGCGWFYEIHKNVHDWNRGDHARWLEKARKLKTVMPNGNPEEFIKAYKAIGK